MAKLAEEMRRVARAAYGPRGTWAYEAFDVINRRHFGGALPVPWIQWTITAHAGCIGLTSTNREVPVITLHPSLLGGTEKKNPWKIRPRYLGRAYAFDVLLHEAMHVALSTIRPYEKQNKSESSHNNDGWVSEVNRMAPRLGFQDVRAGRSRVVRIGGEVLRQSTGNVPFAVVAKFPYALRDHFGEMSYYLDGELLHRHVPKMPPE